MNKSLKYGLIFVAGLMTGGGVSWVINKKRFDRRLEEESEKNQQYYLDLLGYRTPGEMDIPEELENEPASMETVTTETGKTFSYASRMDALKDEFLKNQTRIRYDQIPQMYPEEEVDEVSLEVNNDQPERDIVIITADQFAKEHVAFEKTTLKWWPKNNLLTTDDYEILDIPDIVGTEWKDRIGEFERDTVYVRNFTAETDYEILEQHDSYYDYAE